MKLYPREQSKRDGQMFVRAIKLALFISAIAATASWALAQWGIE
jgi:hypothetical protein